MPKNNLNFSFVDLFSGIGGFHVGLKKAGGHSIGFSEIDSKAIDVYKNNFIRSKESVDKSLGSVTEIGKINPRPDVITGGVPCQPWSVAGKNRGFDDPRGKLWSDVVRIVNTNEPKVFIFENVRGIAQPRNKEAFNLIKNELSNCGYLVNHHVLNAYDFGLPQNRERTFIVGLRNDLEISDFSYPNPNNRNHKLYRFIEGFSNNYQLPKKKKFNPKEIFGENVPFSRNAFQRHDELNDFFIFSDIRNGHTTIHSWDLIRTNKRQRDICFTILKARRKKTYGEKDGNPLPLKTLKKLVPNLKKSELKTLVSKNVLRETENNIFEFENSKNSSGINDVYRVYLPSSDIFSTLTYTGTKDYVATEMVNGYTVDEFKSNFLKNIFNKKKYRKIYPREAARIQGFPKDFILHDDDRVAMRQLGNAVAPPIVFELIKEIFRTGALQ